MSLLVSAALGAVAGAGVTLLLCRLVRRAQRQAGGDMAPARELLDTLLEAVPIPVLVKDEAGRFLRLNQAACEFHGLEPVRATGMRDADIYPPEAAARIGEEDAQARASDAVATYDGELTTLRGERRWVLQRKRGVTLPGGQRGVIVAVLDVSDLREATREIDRARRYLDAVIDAIPQPLCVKDSEHRYVTVNRAFCAAVQQGREALIGQSDLPFHRPGTAPTSYAEDEQVRAARVPLSFQGEGRSHGTAGRWFLRTKAALRLDGQTYLASVSTDITELKEAQLHAERNRAFLDALVNAIPHPLFVKDREHRWVMVNDAACQLLGRSRDWLVGRSDPDAYPRGYAQEAWAEDDRIFATGTRFVTERLTPTPGGERWLLKSKSLIGLPDGRQYIVGVSTDITERKEAEMAARSEHQLLQTVLESTPSPVMVKDERARWILINEVGACFLGASRETFLGRTAAEVYPPVEAQRALDGDFQALGSEGVVTSEGEIRAVDGAVRYGIKQKRAVTLPDGRRLVVVSMTDLTARRAAELERAGALALLNAVVSAVPVVVSVKDQDGRFLLMNETAQEILGAPAERFIGRTDRELYPPEQADRIQQQDAQARLHSAILTFEEILTPITGTPLWVVKRKRGVDLPDGTRGVVTTVFDVTDGKRKEIELRQHRDHLRELVEARTREMREAKEAAERASRAKSEFLANMSHELRTPMHAILSFAQLGIDKAAAGAADAHRLQEYFGRIDQSGSRLLALLDDLLDLARLEAGRMRYEFAEQDVAALAAAAIQELTPLAGAAHVQLGLETHGALPRLRCDATRLGQVLRNLLDNAVKFTPPGGRVWVELSTAAVPEHGLPGAALLLRVLDTGVGIPASELDSIFEKFAQSSRTRSSAGGTGLGLPICRDIVRAHQGAIWAEGRVPVGSCFTVALPMAQAVAPGSAASAANEPMRRQEEA